MALTAQAAWLRCLAAADYPQVVTGGGFAVATGSASNFENGAVITPSVLDRPGELEVLVAWLRDQAVPASVIVTAPPSPAAVAQLLDQGLTPENTGNDMGRRLNDADAHPGELAADRWQITEVIDETALRENHGVYAADGWWDEPGDGLEHHLQRAARLGYGPGRPVRHWTAFHQQIPVGAATSFVFVDTVLLAYCCVSATWRRHGVGTALTRVRLAAAVNQGAVQGVLFPSPDGYQLHRTLGFDLMPVHPNRCFYLR